MKAWHRLPKLVRASVPFRVVFVSVDARVSPVPARPSLAVHTLASWHGVACYLASGRVVDRVSHSGVTADSWWRWVEQHLYRRGTTWIYGDRIGYAITLLDAWRVINGGWGTIESAVLADPPVIIRIRRGGRHVIIADTRNYDRDSGGHEFANLSSSGVCPVGMVRAYASGQMDDCVRPSLLANGMLDTIEWWSREQLGPWAATAASLAWGTYRHSYIDTPIVCHGNRDATSLERDAIFGGRIYAGSCGRVDSSVYVTDVNSLYPHVMQQEQYPNRLIAYSELLHPCDLRSLVEDYTCIAEVDIGDCGSPLPTISNERIMYSTNQGSYILAGTELREACRSRLIRRVLRSATYCQADLFTSYVNSLYPKKVAAKSGGNHTEYQCIKLLLNSLWGKFGQRGRRWVHDPECPVPDEPYKWWIRRPLDSPPRWYRCIAGRCEWEDNGNEPTNSFPAISACVASAGRAYLHRYECCSGKGNVYYMDTDSLHTSMDGFSRLQEYGLLCPITLGRLRHVYSGSDAHYYGPKHYRVGDKWVIGFISDGGFRDDDGVWHQINTPTLEQSIQRGMLNHICTEERKIRLPHPEGDTIGHARQSLDLPSS